MRYSEKRLQDDFTAYVLFSEPLQGRVEEIFAAAAEDYPGVDWSTFQMGGDMIDTRSVTLSTDLGMVGTGETSGNRGRTTFMGHPGRCDVDWPDIIGKSRIIFPEGGDAVARHTDYLSVSVGCPKGETSVAARFDAARRLTCLAAIFAKLPICLGVYFPNGDTLVTPENSVQAAATAMRGEIPVTEWMTIFVNFFEDAETPLPVTVSTIGLAAFNGHELVLPQARLAGPEAVKWIWCTVKMLLEAGHEFVDSNTLGVEGEGKPIRIRHLAEGDHGAQTDQWILIHETSLVDEMKLFGPRTGTPPPPGYDNSIMRSYDDLKNKLYSYVAGGR